MDNQLLDLLNKRFDDLSENVKEVKAAIDKHDARTAAISKQVWFLYGLVTSITSVISIKVFL